MKARNKPKPTRTSPGTPVGTWKLVSCIFEDTKTKERTLPYGEHPSGYAVFTPEGRLMALLTAEGRKVPQTKEERAVAFRSAVAYSGRYRVNGNKFITKVDIAWNEAWVGTDQERFFRIEGDKLYIESPPTANLNRGGQKVRGILVWEREKEYGQSSL